MRKYLYPLFILAILALITYFFGEDLSPLLRKILFIGLLISLFFLFRNVLFGIFGFLFSRFSNLVRNVLGFLLFLLLLWGLWNFLIPQDFKTRLAGGKEALETIVSKNTENILSTVKSTNNEISTSQETATSSSEENVAEENNEKSKKSWFSSWFGKDEKESETSTIATEETTGKEEKKSWFSSWFGKDDEQLNNGGIISYKTNGNTNGNTNVNGEITHETMTANKNSEENGEKNSSETNTENVSQGTDSFQHDGNVVPMTEEKTTPEKSSIVLAPKVRKMTTTGSDLVATGPEDENFEVAMETQNAKMVFPAGYNVSNLEKISNGLAQEALAFDVEKAGKKVHFEVSLFQKGKTPKFERYADFFINVPEDNSITFLISEGEDLKTVYTSFFEGILWDISISSPVSMTENEMYSFLSPVGFKKKTEN